MDQTSLFPDQMKARDVMERDVISVNPETPVLDLHRLFVEEEIHGAPVVGEDGIVYGVISSLDLLRVVRDEVESGTGEIATTYFRDELPSTGADWTELPRRLADRMENMTAADAMTHEIVMVTPDTPLDVVAETMRQHHIHRVLVCEHGVLLGVLTSFDLLRGFTLGNAARADHSHPTGYRR